VPWTHDGKKALTVLPYNKCDTRYNAKGMKTALDIQTFCKQKPQFIAYSQLTAVLSVKHHSKRTVQ